LGAEEHHFEGAAVGHLHLCRGAIFIDTITRPGTFTVQVAPDQRSAEDIFRN
jgi:hypothetical protein